MSKVVLLTQVNLLAHAVAYFSMGATGFLNPVGKFGSFASNVPAGMATTLRVIYGGLMIGLALVFATAAFQKDAQRFGLVILSIVMATLIATRTVGAFVDSSFEPSQLIWSGIELAVLVFSVILYRAFPR